MCYRLGLADALAAIAHLMCYLRRLTVVPATIAHVVCYRLGLADALAAIAHLMCYLRRLAAAPAAIAHVVCYRLCLAAALTAIAHMVCYRRRPVSVSPPYAPPTAENADCCRLPADSVCRGKRNRDGFLEALSSGSNRRGHRAWTKNLVLGQAIFWMDRRSTEYTWVEMDSSIR
jgi:hypothetical protein